MESVTHLFALFAWALLALLGVGAVAGVAYFRWMNAGKERGV